MDSLSTITEKLSLPALREFLSNNAPDYVQYLDFIKKELIEVQIFMKRTNFSAGRGDKEQALIEGLRLTVLKVVNFMSKVVRNAPNEQLSSSQNHDFVKDWEETVDFIAGIVVSCNRLKKRGMEDEVEHQDKDAIVNYLGDKKSIETLLHDAADSSKAVSFITHKEKSQALLLVKAIPALGKLKDSSEIKKFLLELPEELDNLPQLICKALEQQPLELLLIGGLLSLKQRAYDTWNRVKDDLGKIKKSNSTDNIISYCYDDLPYFLKPCFLYLACYPIDYEISARSLTEIWIAEEFVIPEKGETEEETADKYLEQLAQRSLVSVSKRSSLGTIKRFQVPRPLHRFAIQQSVNDEFLVANPNQETMESLFRLAMHSDNKEEYMHAESNHIHSFLAFDFDRNVLASAVFLRVLELRKSAIPLAALPSMIYLRYLCLRGSNISELPDIIGKFSNLETLDVRDTNIDTLPASLWNISSLRHVYVRPNPQIEGPPAESKIKDLKILKTVAVPKSWLDSIPNFLVNIKKLALSNRNELDWKSVSNLLSHLVNLLSLAIIGNTIPSEFVDTRAFRNLETMKSIKLEGKWNCRKLFIDNVKFPPNLTKLTLTNSGLKEDPMPRLEKLQALKFLTLEDGAYTGKKMVCSAEWFPQLQSLRLSKLDNLETWIVEKNAMSQLSKLSIVQCRKLRDIPPFPAHITVEVRET